MEVNIEWEEGRQGTYSSRLLLSISSPLSSFLFARLLFAAVDVSGGL